MHHTSTTPKPPTRVASVYLCHKPAHMVYLTLSSRLNMACSTFSIIPVACSFPFVCCWCYIAICKEHLLGDLLSHIRLHQSKEGTRVPFPPKTRNCKWCWSGCMSARILCFSSHVTIPAYNMHVTTLLRWSSLGKWVSRDNCSCAVLV